MNNRFNLVLLLLAAGGAFAQEQPKPPLTEKPPITFNNSQLKSGETFVYEQKPVATRRVLVAPEQAQALLERFKTNYSRLGSPRLLFYINREYPEAASANTNALPAATNTASVAENTFHGTKWSALPLADRQTMRDLERLFGRPFRMAGATLTDERTASVELFGSRPVQGLRSDGSQERHDREALTKIADVAVEILVSSRQVTLPGLTGDRSYAIPDIQATAIRLKDGRIVGQATAADYLGSDASAAILVRQFDVREIVEATALALMEDMLLNVSP